MVEEILHSNQDLLERVWESIQTPTTIETNSFGSTLFMAGLIKKDRYVSSTTFSFKEQESFQSYLSSLEVGVLEKDEDEESRQEESKERKGILVRKMARGLLDLDAALYFRYPTGEEYIFKRTRTRGKVISQIYSKEDYGKWVFYEI